MRINTTSSYRSLL